jgi:hypothetical protein
MRPTLQGVRPSKRILLAGSPYFADCTLREIDRYLQFGITLVVNQYYWDPEMRESTRDLYKGSYGRGSAERLSFVDFDPCVAQSLLAILVAQGEGFHGIVCPSNVQALTRDVLQSLFLRDDLKNTLRVIGCPNDSISHFAEAAAVAAERGIAVINTPAVHAQSVAEYTLAQLGCHARRLPFLHAETGRDGSWPHT